MSQQLYHNYRDPDSTILFNNKNRQIVPSGVYLGYSVSWSGVGYGLTFTHAADPDNAGSKLGVLVTRDGVVCQENADQPAVAVGVAPGGVAEMHYVLATYVYNASLPANVCNYIVKAVSPVGPYTPTDDEVILASIYVPAGSASYGAPGVVIRNVAKKVLDRGVAEPILDLVGVLKPGIYSEGNLTQGSTWADISLSAITFVTQENWRVTEVAQPDLLTLTDPGAGSYRYAWVIAAHKYETTDPVPSVDYLLVEGVAQLIGTSASLPSDATILAAMAALNPKYTSYNYMNKLGFVRCERLVGAPPVYVVNYYKGETVLEDDTLTVHGAEASSLQNRSGHYYGYQGLQQAIIDVYTKLSSTSPLLTSRTTKPYTIQLDGEFKINDLPLYIPSCVKLKGYGTPAKLSSEYNDVVKACGWRVDYDAVNLCIAINAAPAAPAGLTVPAGQEYLDVSVINLGAYRTGDDLVTHKFVPGDRILFYDHPTATIYEGTFCSYHTAVDNWSFYCLMPVGFRGGVVVYPFNTPTSALIIKRSLGLEDVVIDRISAANANLIFRYLEDSSLKGVTTRNITYSIVRHCDIDELVVSGAVSWGGTQIMMPENNKIGHVLFTGSTSPITVGTNEYNSVIGKLEYDNSAVAMSFVVEFNESEIRQIKNAGSAASVTTLAGVDNTVGGIYGRPVLLTANHSVVDFIEGNTVLDPALVGCLVKLVKGTVTNNAVDVTNRVYHTYTTDHTNEFQEHANDDRNLRILSVANISWDATTGVLSWDDNIVFDLASQIGNNTIVASNVTLGVDLDRAYFRLIRTSAVATPVVLSVLHKAAAATVARDPNVINFAVRYGTCVYLWDGTRIEDGQTLVIGTTPPPDSSVTYIKLSDHVVPDSTLTLSTNPLLHLQKFFRDYVVVEDNVGWNNTTVFTNVPLANITYTAATGAVTYAGAVVDLSAAAVLINAGVPLTLILRNVNWLVGGVGAYTREAISSIDVLNQKVFIDTDLAFPAGLGAAALWNGAIVRGAIACSNEPISPMTYDILTGRVTYTTPLGFSQYQVRAGYVFVDCSGNKYKIVSRDISGAGAWVEIPPGLRYVNVAAPTTRYHGSIETNNNPYNDSLADLRSLVGAEFIPIDTYAAPDVLSADHLRRGYNNNPVGTINVAFNNLERRFITPYDSRVRVWCDPATITPDSELVTDKATYNYLGYGPQSIKYVEFTGVFTDIALAVTGGSAALVGTVYDVWLDGELVSSPVEAIAKGCNNTYGLDQNRYELVPIFRAMRLTQEIHNVLIKISNPIAIVVKGLYVVNSPANSTSDALLLDSPGKAVITGGVVSFLNPKRGVSVPAISTYNKGGRVIRYLDSTCLHANAYTPVRSFTDSGVTVLANPVITGTDGTKWSRGDIVFIYDLATGSRWLHEVTVVAGGSITVAPAAGFNSGPLGTVLYYYGHIYQGPTETMTAVHRETEDVALYLPMSEFFAATAPAGGGLVANRGSIGIPGTPRSAIGVRLSDCNTYLTGVAAAGLDTSAGGSVLLNVQNSEVTISFVGTGLSLHRVSTTIDNEVYVDGLQANDMLISSNEQESDLGGTYICGELPYGQHTVRIVAANAAPSFTLKDITIWQPKKPTFTGLELLDFNQVADSEGHFGITDHSGAGGSIDGVGEIQFGTISYEAGNIMHPTTINPNVLQDVAGAAADATIARYHEATVGVTANDFFDFVFWGDEITLVLGDVTPGAAGSVQIQFYDRDSTWKAPSAITGFTVTETAGDTIAANVVSAKRYRYRLNLGLHILRMVLTNAGDQVQFDAIEIHSPIHVHRTKLPVANDHTVPLCNAGVDKRNLTPFNTDWLPKTVVSSRQGALFNYGGLLETGQQPFCFYSKGGPTLIRCSTTCTDTGAAGGLSMVVDGAVEGGSYLTPLVGATIEILLTLRAGLHIAWLHTSVATNKLYSTHWVAETITAPQFSQLLSRGVGVPSPGPSMIGESTM